MTDHTFNQYFNEICKKFTDKEQMNENSYQDNYCDKEKIYQLIAESKKIKYKDAILYILKTNLTTNKNKYFDREYYIPLSNKSREIFAYLYNKYLYNVYQYAEVDPEKYEHIGVMKYLYKKMEVDEYSGALEIVRYLNERV